MLFRAGSVYALSRGTKSNPGKHNAVLVFCRHYFSDPLNLTEKWIQQSEPKRRNHWSVPMNLDGKCLWIILWSLYAFIRESKRTNAKQKPADEILWVFCSVGSVTYCHPSVAVGNLLQCILHLCGLHYLKLSSHLERAFIILKLSSCMISTKYLKWVGCCSYLCSYDFFSPTCGL